MVPMVLAGAEAAGAADALLLFPVWLVRCLRLLPVTRFWAFPSVSLWLVWSLVWSGVCSAVTDLFSL